jgi:hypothetical protein
MNTQPPIQWHDHHSPRRLALTPGAGDLRLPPRPRRAPSASALLWTQLMRRSIWRLWRTLRTRTAQKTVWC